MNNHVKWQKIREWMNSNGVEVGTGGINIVQSKPTEVELVRQLLTFLYDRRVLYEQPEFEFVNRSLSSVQEIRQHLVQEVMMKIKQGDELYAFARRLRDACMDFIHVVERLQTTDDGHYAFGDSNEISFYNALGAMRRVFGEVLEKIVVYYQVDIEVMLISIFPDNPEHDAHLLKDDFEARAND